MIDVPPTKLLWVDLEMTGLNPDRDVITEVAAIVTDWSFSELESFGSGVKHPAGIVAGLIEKSSFWQAADDSSRQEMLALSDGGKSDGEVEQALLAFIDRHFDAQPVVLAGNSIHQDRRFIRQYWPKLDARLHYRMLDVSAWKIVMAGKFGQSFEKNSVHRAMDDIRESISELQFYLDDVKTN